MTQRVISLEQLSRQLMECAILVKKGERSPLLTQTIHDLTDYMTNTAHVTTQESPRTATAVSPPNIPAPTSDDGGEDDSLRTVDTSNSTTLTKHHHQSHKHPHAFAVLGKMVGLSADETPVRSDTSKQATSSKNAARVKSDLADHSHNSNNSKDPDWCEEHFTRGCACKHQRKVELPVHRPVASVSSSRSAKPAFQRPANPKSSLIANGWIEQQRRSKMRVVWKDVLASLVEARRPGEETTLWIQREVIGSSGKKELEALHQIPIKWLQDVTYLNYSQDNRFTLKVYNLSDDFIFRCQNDPEAAQNWVLTLRSMKEIAQRGSAHAAATKTGVDDWNQIPQQQQQQHRQSEYEDEKKVENQQNAQQYAQQQQQQQSVPTQHQYAVQQHPQRAHDQSSSHRMTITELRAIAHGAGIQTHGMERGELEHIVAQIAQAGGVAPPPQQQQQQQQQATSPPPPQQQQPAAVPTTQPPTASKSAVPPTVSIPTAAANRASAMPTSPPTPTTPKQPTVPSSTEEEEEARKRKEEYERRLREQQQQQEEQERRRKQEEARQRQLQEEERARKEAEEKQKREEAERAMAERVRQKQEEERKAREEAERKRLEEERIRRDEEELRRRAAEKKAAEDRMRQEEAARLQQQQWQQQQQAWMKQQQEEEQRRRMAEQQAAEERRRQEEMYRRHQQQWQQSQQQPQPGYGAPPHQHYAGGGHPPPQNPQYHNNNTPPTSGPGQPRSTPQANNFPNGAPPPQMNSPINVKYAQMAQQKADENLLSIQSVKHGVLLQWALQPPMFQVLRPIHVLLVTIHSVFPPKFGVKGHDYFSKWTAIKPEEVTLGPTQGHRPDDEKIKKCVRKLRLFLHPDKLPKDLDEYQQFMCKMLWDISSDAWEEHKKREEELGWIRG